MGLWKSPIYRFRVPISIDESEDLKEIIIDVTGSAPPFKEPSENLKEILDEIFTPESYGKIDTVLEFGAAKLKNIPYILKKGKCVCAVEFQELMTNDMTKANIKKCKKYREKFQEIIFPNPFTNDEKKFDLILLLNVLSVMPIPSERLFLLKLLHEKLNDKKYLLYVAQKEGSYKKIRDDGNNDIGDGIWMGKGRRFKTFYKYYPVDELDEIMALLGFDLIKRYTGGDDARLYQKNNFAPFEDQITEEKIIENIPVDLTIKDSTTGNLKTVKLTDEIKVVSPNPKKLSLENLYLDKIRTVPAGIENAEIYHRLVSYAMARIFRGSLRNMNIKVEIDGGIKIIDTVFTNSSTKGFFNILRSKIDCSYPMIEVKNISTDPTNVEFDQLNGRLTSTHGYFGILICKKVLDWDKVIARCKTYLPDHFILCLSEQDLIMLIEFSRIGDDDAISDFMDKKLQTILF